MERYSMFLNLEESILWKWLYYQSNLQIQGNPYQITSGIFHRARTKNFTIRMETQKTPNSQSSLKKEEWSWRNQLPDFRLNYKATVIKEVCYWHKTKNIDCWNKTERSDISPHTNRQLIFDKRGNSTQLRKKTSFQ